MVSILRIEGVNESDECRENGGKGRLIRELVVEWEQLVR